MLATEEVGIESLDLHVAVPLPRKLRVWSSFPGPVREGCSKEIHGNSNSNSNRNSDTRATGGTLYKRDKDCWSSLGPGLAYLEPKFELE